MEQEQVIDQKEEAVEVEVADPSIKEQGEQEVEVVQRNKKNKLRQNQNKKKTNWRVIVRMFNQELKSSQKNIAKKSVIGKKLFVFLKDFLKKTKNSRKR